MGSRVLVLGASGFVGMELVCQQLQNTDNELIAVVRNKPAGVEAEKLFRRPNLQVLQWDAASSQFPIADLDQVDLVVNCMGLGSAECNVNPELAIKVNLVQACALQRELLAIGLKHWIQLSTVHVYGPIEDRQDAVVREVSPPSPGSLYASLHLTAELALQRNSEVKTTVLRLSNAFAAPRIFQHQAWKLAIPDMCRQAIECGTITLHSAGKQPRDFIDLASVCQAIQLVIAQSVAWPIINVAKGEFHTIRELAELIAFVATEQQAKTVSVRCPDEAMSTTTQNSQKYIDNSRLKELGWSSARSFSTLITECYEACLTRLSQNNG